MIIDSLCPPAVLYLGFSLIQIIIDLFRGQQNSAFLKVIVMIIFTILLNQLCIGGLTILSWFIVFIPFIMMTYVTTILLYVFGLNPSKGKNQPPDPRRRHNPRRRPNPRPYNPKEVGGCAGTEFGCCPDGVTASNAYGSNCYGYPRPQTPIITNYSCAPMNPGMTPSCHPDMNGIYASIADCEQDPKCPGAPPAPIKPKYACTSIGGMKGCMLDQMGQYDTIETCRTDCNSNPAKKIPEASPSSSTTTATTASMV